MVPNVAALVGLATLVAAVDLQVRVVEKPSVRHSHGTVYERYAQRVGRFVPGLGRFS